MQEVIIRKFRTQNNEEIIELDLNQAMRSSRPRYPSYMDEVERLTRKPEKSSRDFITVMNEDL